MRTKKDPSYIRRVLDVLIDRTRTTYSGLADEWFAWRTERALDDLANDPELEKYFSSLYDEEVPHYEEENFHQEKKEEKK